MSTPCTTAHALLGFARRLAVGLLGGTLNAVCLAATAAPATAAPSSELVARGKYLAQAGDCMACHTAKNGAAYSGGRYIDTPFGAVSTPNITPDKATGIGDWTDAQFYAAMHDGIGHKGEYLYPVMPFPWYTQVTPEDVGAIRAYLATVPAVRQVRPPNQLRFPVNLRQSMLAWRLAFFKPATFRPDESQSADVNRGAYLVNGLAHCGECHNSHPVAGDTPLSKRLQGGAVDNWFAPNITSDLRTGIGGWSNEQIATYLKGGMATGKGGALGPMAETAHSLSSLTHADLLAIAAYLKSTPPVADKQAKASLYQGAEPRGAQTYLSYCASCHGVDGKGLAGAVPALDGSGAVGAKGPQNVISVVLGGAEARESYGPMPAIGAGMSNQDVADVANYVRQLGGNAAAATAEAGMVGNLRKSVDTLMNGSPTEGCPKIESAAVARAVSNPRTGLADQLGRLTDAQAYLQTQRLVASLRKATPGVAQADVINGLTAAYCPILRRQAQLDANARALKLGQFGQLVYSAAAGQAAAGSRHVSAASTSATPPPPTSR